jgi:hypothetical protein
MYRCTAAPVLSKNLTWRMVAESPELERAPGLSGLALITCLRSTGGWVGEFSVQTSAFWVKGLGFRILGSRFRA